MLERFQRPVAILSREGGTAPGVEPPGPTCYTPRAVSSYDYYIWIRSAGDAIGAFLPIIIVAALLVGGLIGWRWWLRSRRGDPAQLDHLEKRVRELEDRLAELEKERMSGPEK